MVIDQLRDRGLRVFPTSATSGEGLRELRFAMAEIVRARREATPPAGPARIVLRPRGTEDSKFEVVPERDSEGVKFRVRGNRVGRWVRQTDFSNDEAVGFLAERLAKLGVEDALRAAGADAGATVVIGSDADPRGPVVFDWEPTSPVDMGTVGKGPRGQDSRVTGDGPRRPWVLGGRVDEVVGDLGDSGHDDDLDEDLLDAPRAPGEPDWVGASDDDDLVPAADGAVSTSVR